MSGMSSTAQRLQAPSAPHRREKDPDDPAGRY